MLASAAPSAERALRAEAVIAAIVEAEQIEPTDEDLIAALARQIEPDERGRATDPAKLLSQLRRSGRLEDLRQDVASEQALERPRRGGRADHARNGQPRAKSCGRPRFTSVYFVVLRGLLGEL